MELEIFEALTAANVPTDKARAAAASIKKEINEHYALHAAQLATKGDLAEMESRLLKAINDSQRWTITATFATIAAVAALSKFM